MLRLEAREWLGRSIGIATRSLNLTPLKGSTSSSLFLVQGARRVHSTQYVLRVLDNEKWLAAEPDLATHEAAALEEAQQAGLRAPQLVAYSPDDVGFGAPVVLMSFIDGDIDLEPTDFQGWLTALAGELASIHRHPAESFPWRFQSWVDRENLRPPLWSSDQAGWQRAIGILLAGEPDFSPVFIHRDYHPTNVLWQSGKVNGVVDWINACRGPAGVDVAHCRVNLTLMYGPAAADQFLERYIEAADEFQYDPYWDLDAVLDACLPEPDFYPPWAEFGLDPVSPATLQQRVDDFLQTVLARV